MQVGQTHYAVDMPAESPPLTPEALARWTDQKLLSEWANAAWVAGDGSSEMIADEIDRRRLNHDEFDGRKLDL
jgi:hypothetical protein